MSDFLEDAIEAGFSREQAEFLDERLAKYPHSHTVEEIDGLEDALEDIEEEEEEED